MLYSDWYNSNYLDFYLLKSIIHVITAIQNARIKGML